MVLKNYINRPECVRPQEGKPVFLSLRALRGAISSDTQLLNDSIRRAGLDSKMYSAKDFRPTGAPVAMTLPQRLQ